MSKKTEKQYNGPPVPKNKKRKQTYDDHLTSNRIKISEAASIKMMYMSGATQAEISRTFNRSVSAIRNVIENIENYLPKDKDLREKIEEQMDQITQEICVRAKAIVDKADQVAYDRLDHSEVGPLDAAKISEYYMNRFAQIMGENRLKTIKTENNQNNIQVNVVRPQDMEEEESNKKTVEVSENNNQEQ